MKIFFKIIYYLFLTGIALVALALLFSRLPIPGNYKILSVLSGSMEPEIKVGSMVVIKPLGPSTGSGQADYKVGDVITFGQLSKTQVPTTHRILEIKNSGSQLTYLTKGDANNAADTKEVAGREILGKVLFSVPYAGYAVDTAKKPLGFIFIIAVPAFIIIFDEILKIIREIKKIKSKSAKIHNETD